MAMTRAQWNALQNRLPAEDRTSYESYLASQGLTTAPATPTAAKEGGQIAAISMAGQTTGKKVPVVTATPEKIVEPTPQVNPWDNPPYPAPAGKVWKWVGAKSVGRPGSGSWKLYNAAGSTTTVSNTGNQNVYKGSGTTDDPLTFNGVPFTGTYNGNNYVNGVLVTKKNDSTGNNFSGSGTEDDPLLFNGTPYNGILGGVTYVNGIAQTKEEVGSKPIVPTLARDTFKNTLALFFGATEASKPWVNALYDVVNKYYRTGSSADESFNLALQDARNNPTLKPFTDRFKGIYALQDMRQAGKPVLVPTIAEYVSSQAKMGEILTQVGMGNLATEEFTGDLIGKGNSVTTIADRISQVFTRIDLAPKAIKDTLSRYFPTVDRTTLARTLLLGEKGTQQLVDELAQYEVLAAAEQQKLGAIQRTGGLTVERAGEYARLGETFQSLTPKFARIAEALPTEEKLAGISGVKSIGQIGLEQAAITGSYEAQKQLKQLTEEEEGRFAGRAGRFASRDRAAGII